MLFKRKISEQLQAWKNRRQGKTALLIEGQRRVGKSTAVKTFAEQAYESFILIDFANCSGEIKALFQDVSDLNYIFLRLQLVTGITLKPRKC